MHIASRSPTPARPLPLDDLSMRLPPKRGEAMKRYPREVLAEIPPSAWRNPPPVVEATEPDHDEVEAACAWSDFRKDYGVSANADIRRAEHRAFMAGYQAGRDGDQSKVIR